MEHQLFSLLQEKQECALLTLRATEWKKATVLYTAATLIRSCHNLTLMVLHLRTGVFKYLNHLSHTHTRSGLVSLLPTFAQGCSAHFNQLQKKKDKVEGKGNNIKRIPVGSLIGMQ